MDTPKVWITKSYSLDPETIRKIERMAAKLMTSDSAIVRQAISELYRQRFETQSDCFESDPQ